MNAKLQLPPTAVMAQLSNILSADGFQNSNILSRFLQFIVEETLAGRESELKEYTIALKVLSKRTDFNPQLDPIVRIHAGRLRRALNDYYMDRGKADKVIISIPKGSYVPEFLMGTHPSQEQVSTQKEFTSRKKFTVAVLPFINITSDSSAVSFADGLGDHISTELTRYQELSVVSYYSCRNIIGKTTDIKELALLLDANYILTGTTQINNDQVRIRVQLILGETGEYVWANSYERKSTVSNLFEIQDEIVRQVISQTAGSYGAIVRNISKILPQKNIESLNVYDAIYWYYHFVNFISEEMFFKAEAVMMKAIETDPEYALGYAVLGEVFVGGYFMGYKSRFVENQLETAVIYGKKAMKIDPMCQHAYQTLALAYLFLRNKPEALHAIDEWTNIRPNNAGIMGAMGSCLIFSGEYERGFKMLDDSVNLNPYYQWWFNGALGFYYFKKDQYKDAIYWAEKMNLPHVPWELLLKTASLAQMNYLDEASECCAQIFQRFPFLQLHLVEYIHAFLQDELLTDKIYTALEKAGSKTYNPAAKT